MAENTKHKRKIVQYKLGSSNINKLVPNKNIVVSNDQQ
jgi:hypothetical protein